MAEVKSDQDWEAESDADTLIRATEIRMDSKRLVRALKAFKRIKLKKEARDKAINTIASKGIKKDKSCPKKKTKF